MEQLPPKRGSYKIVEVLDSAASENPGRLMTPLSATAGDITALSRDEQAMVRRTSATASPYPRDSAIAEVFAEQAQATPDRIAVTDGNQQLTYDQLNDR